MSIHKLGYNGADINNLLAKMDTIDKDTANVNLSRLSDKGVEFIKSMKSVGDSSSRVDALLEQIASLEEELENSGIHIKAWWGDHNNGGRVWSDGYCEQWGKFRGGSRETVEITFPKPFENLFFFHVVRIDGLYTCWAPSVTPTNEKLSIIVDLEGLHQWVARGILKEGTY